MSGASSFSVRLLPSFVRKKKDDSDDPSEIEAVEREGQEPAAEANARRALSRTQSIPVTRSEYASVPEYGSLKSILRPRHTVSKIDEEEDESSGGASMASRFAQVMASVNSDDTDEDDDFGNFSSERRRRDYSPPPLARTRTAPDIIQSQAARSFLRVNELKPTPSGLTKNLISQIPTQEKKFDKFLKSSAQVASVPTRPPL